MLFEKKQIFKIQLTKGQYISGFWKQTMIKLQLLSFCFFCCKNIWIWKKIHLNNPASWASYSGFISLSFFLALHTNSDQELRAFCLFVCFFSVPYWKHNKNYWELLIYTHNAYYRPNLNHMCFLCLSCNNFSPFKK